LTGPSITAAPTPYAARLQVDYPEKLDRFTTFFRLIWVIPIAVVLGAITASGNQTIVTAAGEQIAATGGGLLAGLPLFNVVDGGSRSNPRSVRIDPQAPPSSVMTTLPTL
jgi:hypothetical protein